MVYCIRVNTDRLSRRTGRICIFLLNLLEINDFAEFTYGYETKEFIGENYEDLLFSIDLAHTELESLKTINKNPMINNRLFIPHREVCYYLHTIDFKTIFK